MRCTIGARGGMAASVGGIRSTAGLSLDRLGVDRPAVAGHGRRRGHGRTPTSSRARPFGALRFAAVEIVRDVVGRGLAATPPSWPARAARPWAGACRGRSSAPAPATATAATRRQARARARATSRRDARSTPGRRGEGRGSLRHALMGTGEGGRRGRVGFAPSGSVGGAAPGSATTLPSRSCLVRAAAAQHEDRRLHGVRRLHGGVGSLMRRLTWVSWV